MLKKSLPAFALLCAAQSAYSETTCVMGDAAVYPVMETVKAQFLAGDYAAFSDTITKIMPHQREQLKPAFERLSEVVPEGYDSCETVVQRVDTGGMVQEITTFNINGRDFPIAVYVLAFPVRGELEIALFNFNTSFEPVVESLR